MEYREMSAKEVKQSSRALSEMVLNDGYRPDLVVFIAKGAFQIGKIISENLECSLAEISCSRKGGKSKALFAPILKVLPSGIKAMLREKEMNKNLSDKDSSRETIFDVSSWSRYEKVKKILLVDDSIDSGYSMSAAYDAVSEYFNEAEVRIAVINVFDGSENITEANYFLSRNILISGPWSNDSKEHKRFLRRYEEWKEKEKKYGTNDIT